MIASWMATTIIFTLFLAGGALAIERALRTIGRQARVVWLAALSVVAIWPAAASLMARLVPMPTIAGDGALPAVRSTISALAVTLPSVPTPSISELDAVLLSLWAIASLFLLVRLARALRSLSTVERTATRENIGGVDVLVTPTIGPAVFGLTRPKVIVPRWILDLDESLQALVLRHEQEHCSARDPQLTLAVAVAVAIMPWNVGAWWIARRLRLAMELDCDARVLRVAPDRERYGRLLLFIAQRQSRTTMATMLAESNSDLSLRITEMNQPRPAFPGLRAALFGVAAVGALACSGKYGTDLVTNPPSGAAASTQEAPTYYAPEGATGAQLVETPVLTYPASLRSAGVVGEVLAMFVVDSSGTVLQGSLRIIRSTDSLFTQAVRATVPGMRFQAPELNGRKIRQLVQQSFIFDPTASARPLPPAARPTTDPTNRNPMPLKPIVVSRP